jgi:hypothetical protein
MVSTAELVTAFDTAKNNKVSLYHAGERELKAREALKKAEASVINTIDPKILGSNDKARDAKIREFTCDERADLEKAEDEKRSVQLSYELSCLTVDCLKWQIRNSQIGREGVF